MNSRLFNILLLSLIISFTNQVYSNEFEENFYSDDLILYEKNNKYFKKQNGNLKLFTGEAKSYYYHAPEKIASSTKFLNGKKTSYKSFFDNGYIQYDIVFNDYDKVIIEFNFCENGKLTFEKVLNDQGKGYGKIFNCEGELRFEKVYNNWIIEDGIWESYYSHGYLKETGKYEDGKKIGIWKSYDGLGKIFSEYKYSNDGQNIKYKYFEDGNVTEIGNYKNDKWHGKLETKGNYKDGDRVGLREYFNEDGSLKKTETWKNGVKQ